MKRLIGMVTLLFVFAASSATDKIDLSVAWIQRLPKISYVWNSSNPTVQGWPADGQTVTWVANVRNLSAKRLNSVSYRWLLDHAVVSSGSADLAPNRITKFPFPWKWERKRHTLSFEIDSSHSIPEIEERNNRLLVYTDALGVGFWVEKKFWNDIRDIIIPAGIGATTFDDWMQLRVRQFNEMAALAKYPETPNGVLDRWRIDEINVVPNGSLPVNRIGKEVKNWGADPAEYGTLYPNTKDRTIDMEWGFPNRTIPFYTSYSAWELMYDSLVHELGHARYLIDVYSWDVDQNQDEIRISPGPAANSSGIMHLTSENGIMNTSWGYIDRYSAIALNRIAGHRATVGHYNEPFNIGSFLNDLPESNLIRIQTPDGKIFPNRKVRIYQSSGATDPDWESHVYQLKIDGKPDLEFTTDSQGAILVGKNPFSNGPLILDVNRINTLAIVQLIDGSTSHWGYLESRDFNLEYWRGNTKYAEHQLIVDAPVCIGPGLGPNEVTPFHNALVTSNAVDFKWPVNEPIAVHDFELWYSVDGKKPLRRKIQPTFGSTVASTTVSIKGSRVAWWLVYKNPVSPPECPLVRTSTYFFDLAVP